MGGMCTCGQAHSAECDGEYQIVQCACGRVVVLLPADEERALADALRHLPQPPGGLRAPPPARWWNRCQAETTSAGGIEAV